MNTWQNVLCLKNCPLRLCLKQTSNVPALLLDLSHTHICYARGQLQLGAVRTM